MIRMIEKIDYIPTYVNNIFLLIYKEKVPYYLFKKTGNHFTIHTYTITGKRKRRYKDGDENNV